MAMSTVTVAAAIGAAASVGSAVVKSINEQQNLAVEQQQNEYNAQIAEINAQRERAEYAMNAGLARANARRDIAAARNAMDAGGNIGDSADMAVVDAYLNLSSDLAAMKYQSDTTAVNYLSRAKNLRWNNDVVKSQRKGQMLGSMLGIVGTAAEGVLNVYTAGGFGAAKTFANTGAAFGQASTVGKGGVPMYGGSMT